MHKLNKWLLLGLLALGAIACYAVGFVAGAIVLVAVGGLFELAFWFGLFRHVKRNRSRKTKD